MTHGRSAARLGVTLALVLVVAACGPGRSEGGSRELATPTSTRAAAAAERVKKEQGTGCLPLAPDSQRIDRATPVFSRPTEITNPLFPVSEVTQALQLGVVDGKPFRAEVTLLPGTKTIDWDGRQVPTRIHQYVAYSGGRILEVVLDWYAQADDGSVWYFGEDVFNYEDGRVADTHGTWLAGRDGPPGMIMPADPRPGQVYRPENIPKLVFEQVTVASTGSAFPAPGGPVDGALVIRELHMDGATEAKTFAPGYGEFSAGGGGGDLEAVALAMPVDAAGGPPSAELATLTTGARATFDAAGDRPWAAASSRVGAMGTAWKRVRSGAPGRLADQMTGALDALTRAVGAVSPARARQAALRVEQAALDLELRHRAPAEVDLDRLDLWARQLLVDAAAREQEAVAGDAATLQVLWDRAGHTAAPAGANRVRAELAALRRVARSQDLNATAATGRALENALGGFRASP